MANRGQLRKQRKLAFQDVSFHIEKFSMLQKEWRTVIIFIQLAMKIKNIIKVMNLMVFIRFFNFIRE